MVATGIGRGKYTPPRHPRIHLPNPLREAHASVIERQQRKPTGFMELDRRERRYEPAANPVVHYDELVIPPTDSEVSEQGARCMVLHLLYEAPLPEDFLKERLSLDLLSACSRSPRT